MVEESIVFSGDIDERSLDRSAQTVEKRFSEAGEIQVDADTNGLGMDGFKADGGEGEGGGGTGPLELAGMDSLRKKIPKPIAGVAASSVLPVALAGGVGAGIGAAMTSASNRLQTSAGLLGQAWNSFWRPIGDRVDELFIRDVVKDLHGTMVDFEQTAREEGLIEASVQLILGDNELDWNSFVSELDWKNVVEPLGWNTYLNPLNWVDFVSENNWGDYLDSLDWVEWVSNLSWSSWVDGLGWDTFVDGLGWNSYLNPLNWGEWLNPLNWGDFIGDLFDGGGGGGGGGGGVGPQPNPPGQGEWIWTGDQWIPFDPGGPGPDPIGPGGPTPVRGFQRGGVVQGRTNATLGEAGPEVVQPLSEFERVAERIARTAARQGGGSVDMGRVEGKLDEVNRNLKQVARAMSNITIQVGQRQLGQAVTSAQQGHVYDTDPTV